VALVALALGCASGGASAPAGGPPVFDGRLPDGRLAVPLAELADRATLAPGEAFRVVEIGRDAGSSHHVVAIRTGETPHRHDRHDLLVVMLEGHGTWRLGDETRPVGEGSILYVPRGTVHAFTNESDAPAKAFAVYSPPFDGTDRVSVDGVSADGPGGAGAD
jgi:mannose-6-phosphate isomerase-like protein (cupin superfamily)